METNNRYDKKQQYMAMSKKRIMTDAEVVAKYGQPNITGAGYLTVITSPFPLRLAWDTKSIITQISCHKAIAKPLKSVLDELLAHYGLNRLKQLGIDLYGGCFNYRKMRGGNRLSRHSWAIAIDLDPARNQLNENHTTARFARAEYKPMIDIFYKHGFVNLGVEKDYDWMHWEISS